MSKKLPPGVPEDQPPIPGGMDKGAPPQFGTQKPAEEGGELPRVVNPLERSPHANMVDKKIVRYKVWCRNYLPQEVRYILGNAGEEGEKAVRALYLKVNGLADWIDRLKKNKAAVVEEPDLGVTVLAD